MRLTVDTGVYSLAMELEQVRFLEFILPDEVYDSVYRGDISQEYHKLLHKSGCDANEFSIVERTYRTLLTSIITDSNFHKAFVN
jgi:hypothetical protein